MNDFRTQMLQLKQAEHNQGVKAYADDKMAEAVRLTTPPVPLSPEEEPKPDDKVWFDDRRSKPAA